MLEWLKKYKKNHRVCFSSPQLTWKSRWYTLVKAKKELIRLEDGREAPGIFCWLENKNGIKINR